MDLDEWPESYPEIFRQLDKALRCPICGFFFQSPRTLPCGHSYCNVCIRRYGATQNQKRTCPTCREKYDECHLQNNYQQLTHNLKDVTNCYQEVRQYLLKQAKESTDPPKQQGLVANVGIENHQRKRIKLNPPQKQKQQNRDQNGSTPDILMGGQPELGKMQTRQNGKNACAQAGDIEPDNSNMSQGNNDVSQDGSDLYVVSDDDDFSSDSSGSSQQCQQQSTEAKAIRARGCSSNIGTSQTHPLNGNDKLSSTQNNKQSNLNGQSKQNNSKVRQANTCPICGKTLPSSIAQINLHMSGCLKTLDKQSNSRQKSQRGTQQAKKQSYDKDKWDSIVVVDDEQDKVETRQAVENIQKPQFKPLKVPTKIHFTLYKLPAARKKLRELGLPEDGDVEDLRKRYSNFRIWVESLNDQARSITFESAVRQFINNGCQPDARSKAPTDTPFGQISKHKQQSMGVGSGLSAQKNELDSIGNYKRGQITRDVEGGGEEGGLGLCPFEFNEMIRFTLQRDKLAKLKKNACKQEGGSKVGNNERTSVRQVKGDGHADSTTPNGTLHKGPHQSCTYKDESIKNQPEVNVTYDADHTQQGCENINICPRLDQCEDGAGVDECGKCVGEVVKGVRGRDGILTGRPSVHALRQHNYTRHTPSSKGDDGECKQYQCNSHDGINVIQCDAVESCNGPDQCGLAPPGRLTRSITKHKPGVLACEFDQQ